MVSFQCDGCQDVVKKPKLDSHGSRCHASFTCIDCSKTFAGPAQWKGHISCITEEQKYHKSVYQEPRGRGRGRGQRGRGGRGGRPTYEGSGENAIPLGPQVNAWTAPPPDPVNNEPFNSNEWTASGDKTSTEAQLSEAASPTKDAPEPEKKSKKSKKRKAEDVEVVQTTAATASTTEEPAKKKKKKQTDERVAEPTADLPAQTETKDKKKKKSRKSENGGNDAPADQNGSSNPDGTTLDAEIALAAEKEKRRKEKKEKKEKKKSHRSKVTDEAIPSDTVTDHSTAHSNGEAPVTIPLATFVNNNTHPSTTATEEPPSKVSKSKETTEPKASNGVNGVNGHGESEKKMKSGKGKKKGKGERLNGTDSAPAKEATSEATAMSEPETGDLIPISTIEAKGEKKEKKAKKKKAKDTTDALPVPAPALEQAESPAAEKPKKRKAKDDSAVSNAVSDGASESKETRKTKKSKRRDKETEATVA